MIRPALPSDIDTLLHLEQVCFHGDRLTRMDFRRALRSSRSLVLVETEGDRVRGYALLRTQASRAHLQSLAVDPAARRSGIGRALLLAVEQAAEARGAVHMRLETREDNPEAFALYAAMGYRRHSTLLGYYEDQSDAHSMLKTLAVSPAA